MQVSAVYITTKDKEEAQHIGRILVEERLVACANIFAEAYSIYWWADEVSEVGEAVMVCKTRTELVDRVIERVKGLHTYNAPGITAWEINNGNPAYLQWIYTETRPAQVLVEDDAN